ncbi:MAG: thiamine phosphate synthase [Pseudomonadota bacterium]
MTEAPEQPQLYLITPPGPTLSSLLDEVSKVMDAADIACVRMTTGTDDKDDIARAADLLRHACHDRDVPLLIDNHPGLVGPLGLDGIHLKASAKALREARELLPEDSILGTYAGTSRHDGLTAGEIGADYVSFGPVGETGLGDVEHAQLELFEWWSMMIELPVIAEGGITLDLASTCAPYVDFIALGSELWRAETPATEITRYAERLANG